MRLRAPALLLFALLGEPATAQVQQAAAPMWSPDASRIAFASNRTGDWEIYGGDSFAAWSPVHDVVLFDSNRDGPWEIYRVSGRGEAREKVVSARHRLHRSHG